MVLIILNLTILRACKQGWFGENCSRTCSRKCPHQLCYQNTGLCHSCVGNRTGPNCDDCPPQYYGPECEFRCTVYCKNRTCDKVSGMCHACLDGFKGEYCNLEIEDIYPPVWMLPLIFPFLILFGCCILAGGGSIESAEE